jgi:hypothetical protein
LSWSSSFQRGYAHGGSVPKNGKVCVSIHYGSLSILLAKGKPNAEVGSADELVIALETIKQAVRAEVWLQAISHQ